MNFKNSKFLLGSLMPSSFIATGFRVIGPQERKIRQTAYTRKDQFNVNCNSAIFERKFYKIEIPILPKVLEWAQIYPLKCQLDYHEKCCFPTTLKLDSVVVNTLRTYPYDTGSNPGCPQYTV